MKGLSKMLFLVFSVLLAAPSFGRDIPASVSIEWLEKNLETPKLVVLDIRKKEDYDAGHLAKAVSAPFALWAPDRDGLKAELPSDADLERLISSSGIAADSLVVIVNSSTTPLDYSYSARVATTLLYAGVKNTAIVDGGAAKWNEAKKPLSKEPFTPPAAPFKIKPNPAVFTKKEAMLAALKSGTILLLDARPAEHYFGARKVPAVEKFGHIRTAKSLPVSFAFTDANLLGPVADFEQMALSFGAKKGDTVYVYCNTGVFAAGLQFLMTEHLGFKDVRNYDGSMQEMTKDPAVNIVKYKWE